MTGRGSWLHGMRHTIAVSLTSAVLLGGCAHVAPERPYTVAEVTVQSRIDTLQIAASQVAPAPLRVRVYLPPDYAATARAYPVLYVNDGQDMEAVGLQATLATLYADGRIEPVIVVAIDMPPDRMGAYGLSERAQARSSVAQTVGTNAHAYSGWLTKTLIPAIDTRYRTRATRAGRAVLGWSLGGLNAFNLGWQYPEVFGRVGAFSPSFWLSGERGDADAVQRTRLAQRMVASGRAPRRLQQYLAVGNAEETDDRDGDGINDALDDARDLIDGWRVDGVLKARGLRQRGYSVNLDYAAHPTRADTVLAVLDGGRHNQASWARMLPGFLRWAYAAPRVTKRATAP